MALSGNKIPLITTHYSLIIRELNALVIDVATKIEKHFLFAMTYNQCKMGKKSLSHNCTQAVVCTYYDYTGMDEETLRNVGNAFAAGMGNMEGTCGAIVGAGVVLGLATKDKAKSVKAMRQIMTQFQQRNGATQCKLLKGVGTGKILRECPLCVADAAELLEEQLDKLTDK